MNDEYGVSKVNKVRQLNKKAHYDKATVHAVLDAGLVANVAFVQDRAPVVVPMIYGRIDETLYLHGARKARVIRLLEHSDRACLNVTLLDGIVLARSAFNSSMHYRSATVFGTPHLVDDHDAKIEALRVISEQSMPGRWAELRAPHEREVRMTGVIRLDIESASAKISDGMPDDEDEDYAIPVWAGVLPLESGFTELQADDRLLDGVRPSAVVKGLQGRKL
jgi:nitroimidazol reductase NimA-like FMN-containing flavoprotein (pyridoxamine 5'-phosphate oxidase superfamily)